MRFPHSNYKCITFCGFTLFFRVPRSACRGGVVQNVTIPSRARDTNSSHNARSSHSSSRYCFVVRQVNPYFFFSPPPPAEIILMNEIMIVPLRVANAPKRLSFTNRCSDSSKMWEKKKRRKRSGHASYVPVDATKKSSLRQYITNSLKTFT